MVQWLRLHVSTSGGMGSIPGQGTKIPCAAPQGQKIKKSSFFYEMMIIIKGSGACCLYYYYFYVLSWQSENLPTVCPFSVWFY